MSARTAKSRAAKSAVVRLLARQRPSMSGAATTLTVRLQAAVRDRGQRWTAQRQLIVDVLAASDGHATGAELVERVRAQDPAATPSTVYRTLDLLEEIGLAQHHHGPDGRETYHFEETAEHGHLHCRACGAEQVLTAAAAAPFAASLRATTGFEVDVTHLNLHGTCAHCRRVGHARKRSRSSTTRR